MNIDNNTVIVEHEDNTSGMGKFHEVPGGVEGWSWGAFFFTWLWAISNRTWVGLTTLIPFALMFALVPSGSAGGMGIALLIICSFLLAFAMHFMLGFNGRKWAWQNRRWNDVAHFQRVQRYWSVAAVTLMALMAIGIGSAIFLGVKAGRQVAARTEKLADSIAEARKPAALVGGYMESHHKIPATLDDAGVAPPFGNDIADLTLLPNGQLRVVPKDRPGQGFILAPMFGDSGHVEWRCLSGEVPRMQMPPDCRFDIEPPLHFPR